MRKLVLALLIAVATFAVAAPAGARTTTSGAVTLQARGGYLAPRACQNGPGRFKISVDQAAVRSYQSYRADVTVTGPGGFRQVHQVENPIDGGVWTALWFCRSPNRQGTYTVKAHVDITHDDGWNHWHTYKAVSTTFWISTHR